MKMKYISQKNQVLDLVDNSLFILTNIDGHTSLSASVSTDTVAGMDGGIVNNAFANIRIITFDLTIKPDVDVETAKRTIFSIIKLKQIGTLEWTQNNKVKRISGVISNMDMPRWTQNVILQVSMTCTDPYWADTQKQLKAISESIPMHYFSYNKPGMLHFAMGHPQAFSRLNVLRVGTFTNDGDTKIGAKFIIHANDTVTNPIITNEKGEYIQVGYTYSDDIGVYLNTLTMQAGDNLVISTVRGNKYVRLNGNNVISKLRENSKWLQLETGENTFSVNSSEDSLTNINFTIEYQQKYI